MLRGLGQEVDPGRWAGTWMRWTTRCYEAPTSGGARHEVVGNKEQGTVQHGVAEASNPMQPTEGHDQRRAVGYGRGARVDHHLGTTHGRAGNQRRCPHPHFPEGRYARSQGQTYRPTPIFHHRVVLSRESAEKPVVTGFLSAEAASTDRDSRRTLASTPYSAANTRFASVEAKYMVVDSSIRGGV